MSTPTSTKSKLPMGKAAEQDVAHPTAKAVKTPGGVDISAAAAKAKSAKKEDADKFVADFSKLDALAKMSWDDLIAATGDVGATAAETSDLTKWTASADEKLLAANRSPIRNAIVRILQTAPNTEARSIHVIMRATAGSSFRGSYDKGYLYAPNSKTRGMEARGLVIRSA